MPGTGFNPHHQRILLVLNRTNPVLELRYELERMQWHNAVVVIGGKEQSRRILRRPLRHLNIMQRGVLVQILELFRHVRTSVIRSPRVPYSEFVIAQHVQHPDLADRGSEQLRGLIDASCHQKAAVRAPLDGQFVRAGVAVFNEVSGGALEIVEAILLVGETATVVPFVSVLSEMLGIRGADLFATVSFTRRL